MPKTSSGKIRRSAARDLYESGTITQGSRALWLQLTRLGLQGILHRARRTERRGVELAYAGYWWALLLVFGCFLWPLVVLLPRRPLRHALLGVGGRTFLRLTGIPLEVEGRSMIPEGRVMIIANHASYLDGLVFAPQFPANSFRCQARSQRTARGRHIAEAPGTSSCAGSIRKAASRILRPYSRRPSRSAPCASS